MFELRGHFNLWGVEEAAEEIAPSSSEVRARKYKKQTRKDRWGAGGKGGFVVVQRYRAAKGFRDQSR